PEAGPRRRSTGPEPDVDLRKEVERAGRDPVGSRVAVETGSRRPLTVERDRVAEVRVGSAGRPRERAAVPDEAPRTAHVGGPVVTEDETECGDLVDAGEQPVDVGPPGIASRDADDVVDAVGGAPWPERRSGERGERRGGEERARHRRRGSRRSSAAGAERRAGGRGGASRGVPRRAVAAVRGNGSSCGRCAGAG